MKKEDNIENQNINNINNNKLDNIINNETYITDIINNERFFIIRELGEGGFSNVYLVKSEKDKLEYAAKILKKNKENTTTDMIDKEFEINKKVKVLKNSNIVNLVNYGIGTIKIKNKEFKKKYYIFEYALKGDLLKYALTPPKFGDDQSTKYIFEKILKAVQAFHSIGICHLDIKLTNILLDDNYEPKISDFGLSKTFEESNNWKMKGLVGTPGFKSPQIKLNEEYNGIKSDIFSLGITLFNLVFGDIPFKKEIETDNIYGYIKEKKKKAELNKFWTNKKKKNDISKLSEEFKKLFLKMVAFKEEDRPTIKEILEDEWFNEIRNLNNEKKKELEEYTYILFSKKEFLINQLLRQDNPDYTKYKEEKKNAGSEDKKGNESQQKKYFDNKIIIKTVNPGILMDNYIRIKENINIIDFMNEFANYCCLIFDKIIPGDKVLKFDIVFEKKKDDLNDYNNDYSDDNDDSDDSDDNNLIKKLIIQIKIYKNIANGYYLRFRKKDGELWDYYKKLVKIIEKVKEIIYLYYI